MAPAPFDPFPAAREALLLLIGERPRPRFRKRFTWLALATGACAALTLVGGYEADTARDELRQRRRVGALTCWTYGSLAGCAAFAVTLVFFARMLLREAAYYGPSTKAPNRTKT